MRDIKKQHCTIRKTQDNGKEEYKNFCLVETNVLRDLEDRKEGGKYL